MDFLKSTAIEGRYAYTVSQEMEWRGKQFNTNDATISKNGLNDMKFQMENFSSTLEMLLFEVNMVFFDRSHFVSFTISQTLWPLVLYTVWTVCFTKFSNTTLQFNQTPIEISSSSLADQKSVLYLFIN